MKSYILRGRGWPSWASGMAWLEANNIPPLDIVADSLASVSEDGTVVHVMQFTRDPETGERWRSHTSKYGAWRLAREAVTYPLVAHPDAFTLEQV